MKIAFHTLGCKVNFYETQAISEQFEALGFIVVPFNEFADIYVLNTCSVTGEAARKSRQFLNKTKKINPHALTVATGCYAQEDAKKLEDIADIIIGNNEKSNIANIVDDYLSNKNKYKNIKNADKAFDEKILFVNDTASFKSYEEQKITNQGKHIRAYVKIQDGCNRFCSYCIIPYLRGRSRSRKSEDIISEIKNLSKCGYKEIVLTGIDISDYRSGDEVQSNSLTDLLGEIDEIKGIERIRLGSLESGVVTDDFIDGLKNIKHLCPHFHISLQSGCDSVLKRMNRKYSAAEFKSSIEKIRDCFDEPGITTDIIVGFPGETEEEFNETLDFVEQIRFSGIHVFKYSRRKKTAADKMDGHLTERQKHERSDELIKIGRALAIEYRKNMVGKNNNILVEEEIIEDGNKYITGFTPEYVKIKAPFSHGKCGEIISVVPKLEDFIL